MPKITCIGILVADLVGGPLVDYPSKGKLVTVDNMGLYNGGCATNTSIALARLGIEAAVIGRVGNDGLADFLVNILESNGVDTKGLTKSDKKTLPLRWRSLLREEKEVLYTISAQTENLVLNI